MIAHRTVRGRIRYTSRKPERMGAERGREWFAFTHHTDGSVVLRAQCEIDDPAPTVLRDVILSVGPDKQPRSLHVHLVVGDAFMGSGWFDLTARPGTDTADGGRIECESRSPGLGRISQAVDFTGPVDGFGTHPIVGDGFLTRCIDVARGPHRREIRVFLPSADHRGATPPLIAEVRIGLEYVGDETVAVAAGTFACRRFRYVDNSGPGMGGTTHPDYDLWVTADDDAVFVQGGVGGYMATWYELVDLSR